MRSQLRHHLVHPAGHLALLLHLVQQQGLQDARAARQVGVEHLLYLVLCTTVHEQQDNQPDQQDRGEQHTQQASADGQMAIHGLGIM